MTQAVPWPSSSHNIYTVNTTAYIPNYHIRWRWVYVCIQCACSCLCCIWAYRTSWNLFLICLCLCTSFNTGVTVDTALLRRRPADLPWADIRASMSSSASSSENSCRMTAFRFNQRGDGIWEAGQIIFVLCTVFPPSSSVWVDAASFHKFNQTSQDESVVICLLIYRAKSWCHWVYSKLVSMNEWVVLCLKLSVCPSIIVFVFPSSTFNEHANTQ